MGSDWYIKFNNMVRGGWMKQLCDIVCLYCGKVLFQEKHDSVITIKANDSEPCEDCHKTFKKGILVRATTKKPLPYLLSGETNYTGQYVVISPAVIRKILPEVLATGAITRREISLDEELFNKVFIIED
jgi:hypothetical protein